METLIKPDNRMNAELNRPLDASYRIIKQSLEICSPHLLVHGDLYQDTQTARIYQSNVGSMLMQIASVYDLKAIDANHTSLDYYARGCLTCTNATAEQHLKKVQRWVNGQNTNCE